MKRCDRKISQGCFQHYSSHSVWQMSPSPISILGAPVASHETSAEQVAVTWFGLRNAHSHSVGNVLQSRQILRPPPASATEPTRAPAGRTDRRGVLRASSGRAGADWDVSCLVAVFGGGYQTKATRPPGMGHLMKAGSENANRKRTSGLADHGFVHDYRRLNQARAVVR